MKRTGVTLYATMAQAIEYRNQHTELAQMYSEAQLEDMTHIFAQQTAAQCSQAQDRVKDGPVDFYNQVNSSS